MRLPRPAWVAPFKPNVWALAGAIVAIVYLCVEAQTGIMRDALPALLHSEIADEVRTAALHMMGAIASMQFAAIGIAGLVSWGIKLLDERGDPEPEMPASTHERVIAAVLATLADDPDKRRIEDALRDISPPEENR